MRQYFVLGIGGTGMRCIESLIHLCAIGMFDDTEIHLLALDTDSNNGNFARLKEVKEAYCGAKDMDEAKRCVHKDTFFSANIKYYEFSPDYETKSTFEAVFDYSNTRSMNRSEADLADLFFAKDVEQFNLRHGYRAQTHLGSMMMYHSIIETARSAKRNDLQRYLQALTTACQSGNPRVFILGSVFGGTGASSIPIIPKALSEAAMIVSNGAVNILGSAYFGSTLLTAYFNFNPPSDTEIKNQRIIAQSAKFALNSQVAMMFYDDDTTVKSTYQKFYMLGTDGMTWNPMQNHQTSKTITGGTEQRNDSHYIELLSACAALDFLNEPEDSLQENKRNHSTDYLYRAIGDDGELDFQDFVGTGGEKDKEFAKKFGMLIAFALFNNVSKLMEGLRTGELLIDGFGDIDVKQVENLTKYFQLFFAFPDPENSRKLKEGWLKQLYRSAEHHFLFNDALFSPDSVRELESFAWNSKLYKKTGVGKGHKYDEFIGSKFNDFKKRFIKTINDNKETDGISNRAERAYKLVYDTLVALYKF